MRRQAFSLNSPCSILSARFAAAFPAASGALGLKILLFNKALNEALNRLPVLLREFVRVNCKEGYSIARLFRHGFEIVSVLRQHIIWRQRRIVGANQDLIHIQFYKQRDVSCRTAAERMPLRTRDPMDVRHGGLPSWLP